MTKRMARTPKTTVAAAEQPSGDQMPAEAGAVLEVIVESVTPAPAPVRTKKIDAVIALLRREESAVLAEMIDATGWLPHTTRAALTGLKKKGHVIEKTKRDGVTCYRIAAAA